MISLTSINAVCRSSRWSQKNNKKTSDCNKKDGRAPAALPSKSDSEYGLVTYLRAVDESGKVYCKLVMGKAQIAPLKYITQQRMEIVAATLSVKISLIPQNELQLSITREIFSTDSESVLGYIRNQPRKLKVLVANKVEIIRKNSCGSQ